MYWSVSHRILSILLLIFICLGIFIFGGVSDEFYFINAVIIIFSFCLTTSVSKYNVSTIQIFGLASLILLGLSPRVEYTLEYAYRFPTTMIFETYAYASWLAFIGIISCTVTWFFFKNETHYYYKPEFKQTNYLGFMALSTFSVILISAYNSFDLTSIMYRSKDQNFAIELGTTGRLFYKFILFPMPALCFIMYLNFAKRTSFVSYYLFFMFIIFNSPISMSRWLTAALYSCLLVTIYPNLFQRKNVLILMLFIGLLFVFPFLDFFRHGIQSDDGVQKLIEFRWIIAGHFDSFQNFVLMVREYSSLTYGYQLLGALLFFIPRTLWLDKPISTGTQMARDLNLPFENIAMNFFGEGYINFGLFGVILFGAIFGFILASLDNMKFNRSFLINTVLSRMMTVYFIWVFFCIRGGLNNAVTQIVGISIAIFIVYFLCCKRMKIND